VIENILEFDVGDYLSVATESVRPMKVMIIDDSEPVRRMIASFLDDLVDEFVDCEDGSNALTTYFEHKPDIVLMDIKMNLMDGFRATMQIKQVFPGARIFIVSQWDTTGLRDLAKESGAEGYVSKANLQPLREIIEAVSKPST
jgi:CheY-like chemotaxis protein